MNLASHNAQFVRQKGRLKLFCASDATVAIRTSGEQRQLCQLGYSADGSIRVQWPYLPVEHGIVAPLDFPEGASGPMTIDLQHSGKFTSQLVKYSHHVSGAAHFNKTKYTSNEVRRSSFPLTGPIGRIFELNVFHPRRFKPLNRLKPKRLYIGFDYGDEDISAVRIRAEWRRKSSIIDNANIRRASVGPLTRWMGRQTGIVEPVAFFAPPLDCPIKDHLLCVTCERIPLPDGANEAGIVFMGAYDMHEVPDELAGAAFKMKGCLVAMYPTESSDEVIRRVGSIDLTT